MNKMTATEFLTYVMETYNGERSNTAYGKHLSDCLEKEHPLMFKALNGSSMDPAIKFSWGSALFDYIHGFWEYDWETYWKERE